MKQKLKKSKKTDEKNKGVVMKEMVLQEFDNFFEFPAKDRDYVTSVSCKLFAEHVAGKYMRCLETIAELPEGVNCQKVAKAMLDKIESWS